MAEVVSRLLLVREVWSFNLDSIKYIANDLLSLQLGAKPPQS